VSKKISKKSFLPTIKRDMKSKRMMKTRMMIMCAMISVDRALLTQALARVWKVVLEDLE
jgi:hypothetical protein